MGKLSMIVAMSKNNAIGKDNKLLWHLSSDLKRFKRITSNKNVVMGRKTYESLPLKPLPNRENYILSKTLVQEKDSICLKTIEELLDMSNKSEKETVIIGGETLYKELLDKIDTLYLTVVKKTYNDADTFFPEINIEDWIIQEFKLEYDDVLPYKYYKLKKKTLQL